jgi:hypothetical protein
MSFNLLLKNNQFFLFFCVFGFAINYIAYFPGFLSIDSIYQYGQVIMGKYDDWHPPIMAFFWHFLDKVYAGPALMLLFQLFCLWASGYLLLKTFDNRLWRILVILLLFAPFVQNFAGYVIKDNEMALSWLLAFAIMFRALNGQRKMNGFEAFFSFLLLAYGTWVRSNALPGLLPLGFLWVSVLFNSQGTLKKIALTAGMSVFILGCQLFVNNVLIKPEKKYPVNKLFLQDLTGIYVKTGVNVFPAALYNNPYFDTAALRKRYHPATFDHIWWDKDFKVTIIQHQDDFIERALFQAWEKEIFAHPLVYLKNRLDGFLYYLRIKNSGNKFDSYFMGTVANDFGLSFHRNVVSPVFVFPVVLQQSMPYMKPWLWFFLNFLLLFFIPAFKNKSNRSGYQVLVWSGLLYLLPSFFVFQVDTDFRYFYWNCIACFLAVCILLVDRYGSRFGDNKPALK